MPLFEKLRIEVFIPAEPHPAYRNLLDALQDEFVESFGGCAISPHFDGRYWSTEQQTTILDKIQLLLVDTNLTPSLHMTRLEQYLDELHRTILNALQEED